VVVIPGRNFGPYVPQLFFPMFAAVRRGATAVAVEWSDPGQAEALDGDALVGWVDRQVGPILRGREPRATLLVAKSLGTLASAGATSPDHPAIWVTPLLTHAAVVAALGRWRAPFLLVGGTADPLWDGAVARKLTPHVVEMTDADHGLFEPGPLDRSARNIAVLARAAEEFIDEYVWAERGP